MNLAPENTDNIIANLHDEVRRQEKVIAALREALFEIAQMPPLKMTMPGSKEPKVFDAEQKVARAALLAANEQDVGK